MLEFAVKAWVKNKGKLEEDLRNNGDFYRECLYKDIVKKTVELVLNGEYTDEENGWFEDGFLQNSITEVNDGDYQGTLIYLIPVDTYQPSLENYLVTSVGYGSCSGCDTLMNIQGWEEGDLSEEQIKDFMTLALHLVQKMKWLG